ncbi:MAG: hypothetical protein V1848_00995 [Candidatus Magasanikbacteria bacterium]
MPYGHATYTLFFFEQFATNLPPLLPDGVKEEIQNAYEQLTHNVSLTSEEIDDTLIVFGKRVWPYRQAFLEFYRVEEGHLAEKVFLKKAHPVLRKRYNEFLAHGGSYENLYKGISVDFFTSTQRVEIAELLTDIRDFLNRHTRQSVIGLKRKEYLKKIHDFEMVYNKMEEKINVLRDLADKEAEHPEFFAEIQAHIRSFEEGMCLMHTGVGELELEQSLEHFHGRKFEKKKLKH